jgi:hypothetical protein
MRVQMGKIVGELRRHDRVGFRRLDVASPPERRFE